MNTAIQTFSEYLQETYGNMYIKWCKIARKFHQISWCLVMFWAKHCATVGGAYPVFSTCSKVLVDERGLRTWAKAVHETTINSARSCPAKCSLEAIFVSFQSGSTDSHRFVVIHQGLRRWTGSLHDAVRIVRPGFLRTRIGKSLAMRAEDQDVIICHQSSIKSY